MNVDHMGKMFRVDKAGKRERHLSAIQLQGHVSFRGWKAGKDFVDQVGNHLFCIWLDQIVHGADTEAFQRVVCGGSRKDQQAACVHAPELFCSLDAIYPIHINIQK